MLHVFKSLPVVQEICREEALPSRARSYARDTITLGWEERLKARGRRRSEGGGEFGTALPRGMMLRGGDCFVLDDSETCIAVIEQSEPVLIIEPRTASEWGLFGYHIGNGHQPVMITEREIICPDVPGVEQVLEQHAIAFRRDTRPFTPAGMLVDHRH